MFATLLIVFLAITFVSSIAAKVRKALAEIEGLPAAQPDTVPQQEMVEPEEATYFSYENEMSDITFQPAVEPQQVAVVEPAIAAVPAPAYSEVESFDLRKAVIYEAILCNPYKG